MVRKLTVFLMVLALASVAFGQKTKELRERSITGVVTNDAGQPVPGAVVQLKNTKTLQVRSFIANEKGEYYFHGLATDVDYQVKAEWNGKASNTRTLSTFDSHPEVVFNLQVK